MDRRRPELHLLINLEGPASIGSPVVILFDQPCGNNDDINCTLDDDGIDFICSSAVPAITGVVKPEEALSSLNGLIADGTWLLRAGKTPKVVVGRDARISGKMVSDLVCS